MSSIVVLANVILSYKYSTQLNLKNATSHFFMQNAKVNLHKSIKNFPIGNSISRYNLIKKDTAVCTLAPKCSKYCRCIPREFRGIFTYTTFYTIKFRGLCKSGGARAPAAPPSSAPMEIFEFGMWNHAYTNFLTFSHAQMTYIVYTFQLTVY